MTGLIDLNSQMLPADQLAVRANDCGFTLGGCEHFLELPPTDEMKCQVLEP
jgi:hypothetical protein